MGNTHIDNTPLLSSKNSTTITPTPEIKSEEIKDTPIDSTPINDSKISSTYLQAGTRQYDESKHDRDNSGKFTSGSGDTNSKKDQKLKESALVSDDFRKAFNEVGGQLKDGYLSGITYEFHKKHRS